MEKRLDLSEEDLEIINQIIIRCAVKLHNFIEKHSNPKKYSDTVLTRLKSNKTICYLFLFPQLLSLNSNQLYSPSELKIKVATDMHVDNDFTYSNDITVVSLADEIISDKYITDSTLSKLYKDFTNEGLLINIKDKNEVKKFRFRHGKTKKLKMIYKTEGRISFYTVSTNVEITRKILSNPDAVKIINSSLKESGLLYKFMQFMLESSFYLSRTINATEEVEILKKAIPTLFTKIYPHIEKLDMHGWESYKKFLSSLDEKSLEKLAQAATPILEDKLGFPYIVYGLSKL